VSAVTETSETRLVIRLLGVSEGVTFARSWVQSQSRTSS
jgi:hypothetical protein